MTCHPCARQLADDARFCDRCGVSTADTGAYGSGAGGAQAPSRQTSATVILAVIAVGGLVLVAFIGVVAAIALPNLLNAVDRGKQKRTMSDLRTIGAGVEMYRVAYGIPPNVPASDDAAAVLAAHLEPTFLRVVPRQDGWQHGFAWRRGVDGYTLISYGKDGVADELALPGQTTSFRSDIYFASGEFTRYPEGTQE